MSADARLDAALALHLAATRSTAAEAESTAAHARTLAASDRADLPRLTRSVLVVDDEAGARSALVTAIRRDCAVVVHEAATVAAATIALARYHPTVIVCDWCLRCPGTAPISGLRWLHESVPRCYRACLVSGQPAAESLTEQCRVVGVRSFVRPTTHDEMSALTAHVRALLDAAAPPTPPTPSEAL